MNLDHCSRIEPVAKPDDDSGYDVFDAKGKRIGFVRHRGFDPSSLGETYVPAAPGTVAYVISAEPDSPIGDTPPSDGCPTMDDVCVIRLPVVAWALDLYGEVRRPVLLTGMHNEGAVVFCEGVDGEVHSEDVSPVAGLEEAKRHVLWQRQYEWDRAHSKDAKGDEHA